ncbi:hypothetical protein [uncultured Amnibacterium sp.]|uniref:hypothetical protein n=1 Tax=uncultured Amnibacterium sp. TaxID=1631851 RepID=UPI0035CB4AC6
MPGDDADALRRRLYGPDASAEDVARYEAVATDAVAAVAPIADAPDRPAPRSRRPRRRLTPVVVVAVAVVVAAIGVAALRVGEGQRQGGIRAPQVASSDRSDREGFQQNLAEGREAGIAAYLVTHRSPEALSGATRYFTIEKAGTGTVDLPLAPVPADTVRGRATVLLVLGGDAVAAWTTYRRQVDSAGEQQWIRQTARGGEQAAGVLTITTFRYDAGDRPVRLAVDVDDGVRWGVAVVFSD